MLGKRSTTFCPVKRYRWASTRGLWCASWMVCSTGRNQPCPQLTRNNILRASSLFVLAKIYGPTLRWITPIEQKVFSNSYRLKDHEFIMSSLLDFNQLCWISTFYHFFVPSVRYHCNSPRLETDKRRSNGCGSSQSRNISQVRTLRLRLHGANWDQGWHWMCMLLDLECQQLPALTSAKSCAQIDGNC